MDYRSVIAALTVWIFSAGLFYFFFIHAWPHVVKPEDGVTLSISIGVLIALIALCSLIETAVSANTAFSFNEWHNGLPTDSRWPGRWFRDHGTAAVKEKSKANAMVVLLNTILTVVLSVVTLKFVTDVDAYTTLGMDPSNGFVIVGVTVLIFLLGETLPKQFAIKFRYQTLLIVGFLPSTFALSRATGWIATGITYPFLALFGPVEE